MLSFWTGWVRTSTRMGRSRARRVRSIVVEEGGTLLDEAHDELSMVVLEAVEMDTHARLGILAEVEGLADITNRSVGDEIEAAGEGDEDADEDGSDDADEDATDEEDGSSETDASEEDAAEADADADTEDSEDSEDEG